ncbi:MAG: hypothetical protein IH951_00345 [Bacteroidetes bacterium]|nr:hypothetical protein [Bacteroidota bacterium]
MSGERQRKVDFDRLNLVGKAIFITGTTARVLGTIFDSVVETVSGIVREAEKAFKSGLDANVDDATILEEHSKKE